MGILDDAIKEHLELKRAHGADAAELKQLEDEAFGAAERPGAGSSPPDPAAEAPTEFMQQPDLEADAGAQEAPEVAVGDPEAPEPGGRRAELPDLQEGPPAPEPIEDAAEPAPEQPVEPEPEQPAEEEAPAMEHEAISQPPLEPEAPVAPTGPTTEEREAIAEQPTEMYDIEEELAAAAPEAEAEEELVEAGGGEDEAAYEDDEDDDFWDEKRLSDELDQALEAPVESDGDELAPTPAEETPATGDAPEAGDRPPAAGDEEDVLEETPDFLDEDDDDQLWFEQKPPKDFDFDD